MAFSAAEESRIINIERRINALSEAVKNLSPKEDLVRYSTIRQAEIESLTTRIAALETQLRLLQSR